MNDVFQITAINAQLREIEGTFMAEVVNENGPIYNYDASRRAFLMWRDRGGIVLAMYDQSNPIGKCTNITFDDSEKLAIIRVRVSRSAEETWQKIVNGILLMYGFTYVRAVYNTIERNGQLYPYLIQYDVLSLSLVGEEKTDG